VRTGKYRRTRLFVFTLALGSRQRAADNSKNVGAYDIDGWNKSAEEVVALHTRGSKVVCYHGHGHEPGRPEYRTFPALLKGGAVAGWPGELWLDVRPSGPNQLYVPGTVRLQREAVSSDVECSTKQSRRRGGFAS